MKRFSPSIRNFGISIEECVIYLKNVAVHNYTIITRISSSNFACFFLYRESIHDVFDVFDVRTDRETTWSPNVGRSCQRRGLCRSVPASFLR